MKINEIITEGVWDNLKTAGQNVKQRAGTIGQGIKQGAGAVANYAKQNYQQTMQARQQRFDQQAAQEFPQPKKLLGKEYSQQAQLKAKNAGTFMGDLAKTIGAADGKFTQATNTIGKKIPVGTEVEVPGIGKFIMEPQGWTDEKNQPVTNSYSINDLNNYYYQGQDGLSRPGYLPPSQPVRLPRPPPVSQTPQVDTSKIQPAPRAGQPTPDEQAKLQAKLQAALQNQQGQQ